MQIYDYKYIKTATDRAPFDAVIDYGLKVPCTGRDVMLDYIFRSYRYGSWLYVTDIFPQMYENDNNCFKRFTSHEGLAVNMRRLSVTCVVIFVNHFIAQDPDSAMVISGSYAPGEPAEGMSRKLKLYRYFFMPLLDELDLRSVDMLDANAFILVSKGNCLSDDEIRQKYMEFKSVQKRNN